MKFGDYRVLSELGQGSISIVYEAEHVTLGRRVAIKALKPQIPSTSSFAAQLEREARVLSGLSHPNVVMLIDFVKSDGGMYLVLEYVGGHSLAEIVSKKHRLRGEIAAAIALEVASGIAHAHERGVVHRDVKPANIILTKTGEVKVVDFSVAHRERLPTADEPIGEQDRSASFGGTPAYMAPEQILGEQVDEKSDVFSLGIVLYQMLAAVRPFDRQGDKPGTGHAGRRRPAVALSEHVPEVSRTLERIVARSIEKHPADRPTMHGLQKELAEYLRKRTEAEPRDLVKSALAAVRLLPADVSKSTMLQAPNARRLLDSPWSFVIATILLGVGFGLVRVTDPQAADPKTEIEGTLEPNQRGFLRVLATPWAEVAIDGVKIDATPIARAIPVAPGLHFVTFTHPAAKAETRRVVIETGKTTVLDVAMAVTLPDATATATAKPVDAGIQ
ncbi:hypothetical protein BH09MYX1_BH09MYX1_48900 [soil metagenome]